MTEITAALRPSVRSEYEITDVNMESLRRGQLKMQVMNRSSAWLDTGTHESLRDASSFVQMIEKRQGLKIDSREEVAWRMGFVDDAARERLDIRLGKSGYGSYPADCWSNRAGRRPGHAPP